MKRINRDTNWPVVTVVLLLLMLATSFSLYKNYVNDKEIKNLHEHISTMAESFELKNNELSSKIGSISKVRSKTVYTNVILKLEGGFE